MFGQEKNESLKNLSEGIKRWKATATSKQNMQEINIVKGTADSSSADIGLNFNLLNASYS